MKAKPLPKGARLIRPFKKQIGGWVEQEFDAKCLRLGLTWYRVKDGFGGHGDREDWVADVPSDCISVHDYQWRRPRWGFDRYDSFDEAVVGQLRRVIEISKKRLIEKRNEVSDQERSIKLIEEALKKNLDAER